MIDRKEERRRIEQVYELIRRNGPLSEAAVCRRSPVSDEDTRKILRGLNRAGKIRRTKVGWVA